MAVRGGVGLGVIGDARRRGRRGGWQVRGGVGGGGQAAVQWGEGWRGRMLVWRGRGSGGSRRGMEGGRCSGGRDVGVGI